MLAKLDAWIKWINRLAYLCGAVAVALMMIQTTAHALSQYIFNYPLPGTIFFISNYYMVVVTFMCIGAVQLKNAHISVDIFTNTLPVRLQRFCAIFAFLVTAAVFSLLAWQGMLVAESRRIAGSYELENDIKFLLWPSFYLVPIGSGLMVITVLNQLLRFLVLGETPVDAPGNDADEAHGAL